MFLMWWKSNRFVRDDHTDSRGGQHRGRMKESVRRRFSDDGFENGDNSESTRSEDEEKGVNAIVMVGVNGAG